MTSIRVPAPMNCPVDLLSRAEFFDGRASWLEARRSGIGGSEVAIALGLSPWRSPYSLWAEKVGEIEPEPDEPNLNMRCGTLMEPVIRTLWQEARPGARVFHHPAWIVRHPEMPWLYSSLDWSYEEDGILGIGEAKAPVSAKSIQKWDDDNVPVEYQLQGQHGLLCSGREVVSFVRLLPGRHGWDFSYLDVRAHDACRAMMIERLTEFWRLVETRTPPPVDAHETTRETLRERARHRMENVRPGDDDPKAWCSLPPEAAQVHADMEKAKADEQEAKGRAALAHNKLVEMLNGRRFGVVPGVGLYTYRMATVAERTQTIRAHERWSLTFSDKITQLPPPEVIESAPPGSMEWKRGRGPANGGG